MPTRPIWIAFTILLSVFVAIPAHVARAAELADWGGAHVGKDADGHIEASLRNSRLSVRYGYAPATAEGWITDFVFDGSPNMAGEMLDASAGRGTLVDATIIHDGSDCKTIDLKWKLSPKSHAVYEQTITIYPNLPVLRIDYLNWNVNTVDIGHPGGEKRSDKGDNVQYTIYGSDHWKRDFVSYPMIYMDRAFWDVGFNGLRQTDDPTPLDYHGYLIMGITSKANGMGFGRVVPAQSVDVVKLLVHAGFELFPCFKREHQPFASYLFAVKGGPQEVLSTGQKLADGGYPEIPVVTAAPQIAPAGGVFTDQAAVTLSAATPGSVIHFTTDGAEPTEASPVYSEPISLSSTTQLCAKAWHAGWQPSVTAKAYFVIAHQGKDWWRDAWTYRVPVDIGSGAAARSDAVASVPFDFDAILKPLASKTKFSWPSLRVTEVDAAGKVIDENVVYQWDSDGQYYSSNKGTLHILLKGNTAAGAVRHFHVYFDTTDKNLPGIEQPTMMDVHEDVPFKGQKSYEVIADRATWYLHESGGGLAGLIDADGNDWIGYQPENGPEGEERGIPNCGAAFHPGYPNAQDSHTLACQSDLTNFGPLHTRVTSATADNAWAGRWDFYPDHVRFTITKAPAPYSFVYAGTPAGKLDLEKDFYVTSDGARRKISDPFTGQLQAPRWIFIGKQGAIRGLLLGDSGQDSPDVTDEFRQLNGTVVQWAFGTQGDPPKPLLTQLPRQMTIAFLEPPDLSKLSDTVKSVFTDLDVNVGSVEQRP